MDVELQINNSVNPSARFLTWAPSACRIRVTNPAGVNGPIAAVRITGASAASAGAVIFSRNPQGPFTNSVTLQVPTNGNLVPFFVAGRFGRPSINNGDVRIEARRGSTLVGSVPVMVRIRKNAQRLTPGERDRFVAALAQLNNRGTGPFTVFRDMHTDASDREAHGGPGFLPWHRAYLLDFERELQAIDPSVALPYWRFDQPAPNIFTREFLGVSDNFGFVRFSPTNPLQFWRTDGVQGINRSPFFPTNQAPPAPMSENSTLALGDASLGNLFRLFRRMQGNPHGFAHTSFGGSISDIDTAAKDPLFFLLHCNVDRLWAKWQRRFGRFDPAQPASYDTRPQNEIGHRLGDTMWPWNGITGNPRPPTAPGGPLFDSIIVNAPGQQPRVRDCLDYQGAVNGNSRMGFDYDDVQFF